MALTAPWRDGTCRAPGQGPGGWAGPDALSLPGLAALIDLSGLASEYWQNCQFQKKNEVSLEALPAQVGLGGQSHLY